MLLERLVDGWRQADLYVVVIEMDAVVQVSVAGRPVPFHSVLDRSSN